MKKLLVLTGLVGLLPLMAQAGTDALEIATDAETAFETIAPIVIAIATFFVVVRIAKRVVK